MGNAGWDVCDESGTVVQDAACRKCGYNLRGLHRDGLCPECASPIQVSIRGDLLRCAEPHWVGKLAVGTRLLFWAILAVLGMNVVGFLLPLLFGIAVGVVGVVWALSLAWRLLEWYGLWLITKPDPRGPVLEAVFAARRLVRLGVLVEISWTAIAIFLGMRLAPGMGTVVRVLWLLIEMIVIIVVFATLLHLEKLAGRIPRDRWAQWLCVLRWTLCSVLALGFIQDVAAFFAGPFGPSLSWRILGRMMIVTTIVRAAIHLPYLVLLWKLGTAFRKQADLARQSWGMADRDS